MPRSWKSSGGALRPVAYTDDSESSCRAVLFVVGLVFILTATVALLIYHLIYPAARLSTITTFDIHELLGMFDRGEIMSLSCPCQYTMKYADLNQFYYYDSDNVTEILPIDFNALETQCLAAGETGAEEYSYSTLTTSSNTSVQLDSLLSADDCNATNIAYDLTRRLLQSKAPSQIVPGWAFKEELRDVISDECYSFFEDRSEMFYVFQDYRGYAWDLMDWDQPCYYQSLNGTWAVEDDLFLQWVNTCSPESCSYIKNAGFQDAVLDTVALSGTLSSVTITTLALIYKLFVQRSKPSQELSGTSHSNNEQLELDVIHTMQQ